MINNSVTRIKVPENNKGNLFSSSSVSEPKSLAYYTTVHSRFGRFLKGLMTLRSSFNKRPSVSLEITKNKTTAYHTTVG